MEKGYFLTIYDYLENEGDFVYEKGNLEEVVNASL